MTRGEKEERREAIITLANAIETFHILTPKKVYSDDKAHLYVHEDHVYRYGYAGCNLIYVRELNTPRVYDFRQLHDPYFIFHSPTDYYKLEGLVADFCNDVCPTPCKAEEVDRIVLRF